MEGVPKTLEQCVAKCLACPSAKCTYISFSVTNADCSWYESCDMANLYTVPGKADYQSQVVRGADGSGRSLVATLLATVVVYLVAGVIYGRRTGNPASGLAAHPQYAKFVSLHGLVTDGVAYARGRRGTEATRYTPLGSSGSSGKKSSREDDDVPAQPHKESVEPSKRSKSTKRQSEQRKDSRRGASRSNVSDRADQTAPALDKALSAPAGSQTAGTASAGGGRWVHVPN